MKISLKKLNKWSAFKLIIWPGLMVPITKVEVKQAIANKALRVESYIDLSPSCPPFREQHIQRIAFLVINKDNKPIEIDVGVPSLGCRPRHIICDGNHRLAAAFYRRDKYIEANVSGSVDLIKEMFVF